MFNAGIYVTDYTDGDEYTTTQTYTASNGSCYSGIMFVWLNTRPWRVRRFVSLYTTRGPPLARG